MPKRDKNLVGILDGPSFGVTVRAITKNTMSLARKTKRSPANYRGLNIRRKK